MRSATKREVWFGCDELASFTIWTHFEENNNRHTSHFCQGRRWGEYYRKELIDSTTGPQISHQKSRENSTSHQLTFFFKRIDFHHGTFERIDNNQPLIIDNNISVPVDELNIQFCTLKNDIGYVIWGPQWQEISKTSLRGSSLFFFFSFFLFVTKGKAQKSHCLALRSWKNCKWLCLPADSFCTCKPNIYSWSNVQESLCPCEANYNILSLNNPQAVKVEEMVIKHDILPWCWTTESGMQLSVISREMNSSYSSMFWVSRSINKQIWRGWQHEIPPREEVACLPLQPFCHENQAKRLKPNASEEKEVMQNQIFPKEKLGSPAAKGDLGEEQKRGARMCPPSHLQVTSSSDMKVQGKWSWMHSVQDFHCKYQNKGGIPPKHCPEIKGQGKGRPKMETSRAQQEYKVQLKCSS